MDGVDSGARMAERGSPEWRANVSRGTKRAVRPWRDGLNVLGPDVQLFIRRGMVAESLKSTVSATAVLVGEYAAEKGGVDQLTVGQKALLDLLFMQRTARAGLFSSYLRHGKEHHLAQALAFANAEARTIQLLGLERREKDVTLLADYLAKAAEDAPTRTNGDGRGSPGHGRRRSRSVY